MSSLSDRRDTRRIIVGAEYCVRFLLKGHQYQEVRISNLSAGGCFALVGHRDARLFERGAVLEQFVLLHPELPKEPMIASVAYVIGGRQGGPPMEFVGVGIQFLSVEPTAKATLEAWVDAATASQQS